MNSKEHGTRAIVALVGGLLGVMFGAMISSSTAHTPCNDTYQQPQCKYVQVINPYTGQLETQYVCK